MLTPCGAQVGAARDDGTPPCVARIVERAKDCAKPSRMAHNMQAIATRIRIVSPKLGAAGSGLRGRAMAVLNCHEAGDRAWQSELVGRAST
jgi:hypothetical protein